MSIYDSSGKGAWHAIKMQCFPYLSKNKAEEQTDLQKVRRGKQFLHQTEAPL